MAGPSLHIYTPHHSHQPASHEIPCLGNEPIDLRAANIRYGGSELPTQEPCTAKEVSCLCTVCSSACLCTLQPQLRHCKALQVCKGIQNVYYTTVPANQSPPGNTIRIYNVWNVRNAAEGLLGNALVTPWPWRVYCLSQVSLPRPGHTWSHPKVAWRLGSTKPHAWYIHTCSFVPKFHLFLAKMVETSAINGLTALFHYCRHLCICSCLESRLQWIPAVLKNMHCISQCSIQNLVYGIRDMWCVFFQLNWNGLYHSLL